MFVAVAVGLRMFYLFIPLVSVVTGWLTGWLMLLTVVLLA